MFLFELLSAGSGSCGSDGEAYTLVLIHVDVAEITVKDFLSQLFGACKKRSCDLHIRGKVFVIKKKNLLDCMTNLLYFFLYKSGLISLNFG